MNDVAIGLNRKRKAPPTSATAAAVEGGGSGDVEHSESAAFTRVCMIVDVYCSPSTAGLHVHIGFVFLVIRNPCIMLIVM